MERALPTTPVAAKIRGLPLTPLAAAVTLFTPTAPPSCHDDSAATPLASVVTDAGLAGLIFPPPAVTLNITTWPATTLPCRSVTLTAGGAVTGEPAVADCDSTETADKTAATPTVPVAVKVNGLPASPETVAVTALVPTLPPSVHEVSLATPAASVSTTAPPAGTVRPPPITTSKVTGTPPTGLPKASVTFAAGAAATAVPAVAVCVVADKAASVLGEPMLPCARNVTGLPTSPVTEAVSTFGPAAIPRVHDRRDAIPPESVTTLAGLTGLLEPPPPVITNATGTPATPDPPASVTFTRGAVATEVPAAEASTVSDAAMRKVGDPTTTEMAADACIPSTVAWILALPMEAALTTPRESTTATALSLELHAT